MFDDAISFVLQREGGYSQDPNDPGGETNFGISKAAYPNEDIEHMTMERAMEIYRDNYWNTCMCDKLPPGLALLTFDMAVNQGTDAAIRNLQSIAGSYVDGVIGQHTLEAARNTPTSSMLAFTRNRIYKYGCTANFARYGKGWVERALAAWDRARLLK